MALSFFIQYSLNRAKLLVSLVPTGMYLNLRGDQRAGVQQKALKDKVKKCWSSLSGSFHAVVLPQTLQGMSFHMKEAPLTSLTAALSYYFSFLPDI